MTARNRRREHREMLRVERGAERLRGRVEREPLIDAEKQGQRDGGAKGECEEERRGQGPEKARSGRAAVRPCGRFLPGDINRPLLGWMGL